MKLKKGDIILNRWAGANEGACFIYTGTAGRYVNGIQLSGGRLSKVQYYKSDMDKGFGDGQPVFKKLGHTDAYDIMKRELNQYQERLGNY